MYNRMYGTADGDRILQELGKILRRMFGRVPATRITGGQFVLLTQDVALEVMIPRLQRSFQALEPRTRMVLKVGIYETAPEDEDVLHDAALGEVYFARRGGRYPQRCHCSDE